MNAVPRPPWRPALAAFAAAIGASIAGRLATDLGPWYRELAKPTWQPPDWAFGPVWTTIYALCVVAATLAWLRAPDGAARRHLLWAFAVNLALNVGWSVLFFRLQRPDWAVAGVGLLWLSIAALIFLVWPWSRLASLLLTPYLAWVGFAAFLNLTIVQLNAPFAGG
jgi:tryptophan-rich sensory protein